MIIALDPGFGNTKTTTGHHAAVIQTAVSTPNHIGMADIGMKKQTKSDLVTINNTKYVVGANSWNHGTPIGGMDFSNLVSEPRLALFYAALFEAENYGTDTIRQSFIDTTLVIGLPVPLLQNEQEARLVLSDLKKLKRTHDYRVNNCPQTLEISKIKVLAQPVGAYTDWLLNWELGGELVPRKGGKDSEVAILDIGMNTLDLYVIQNGQIVSRFIGGAKVGVHWLLASDKPTKDLVELDADLRSGKFKPTDTVLSGWFSAIMDVVEERWPNLNRFDAVIPTGGGALLLKDQLNRSLTARGAALHFPEDPITANVLGFWKWGRYEVQRKG